MKMAEDSSYLGIYCGTWKIVEFMPSTTAAENMDAKGIEGTEFRIDDSGDILWKVADGVSEPAPFCYSETFEIVSRGNKAILKLFGSDVGNQMEFEMELSADLLLLTFDSLFMLQCQRVSHNDLKIDFHFAFLNALEDGYFSDLTLVADSGKEVKLLFKVHKTILWLSVPQLDFDQVPVPLSGLPEDVLHTVLHYLYCECLPVNLSEDTAKSCVQAVGRLQGLTRLVDLCELFLKNNALKQQIISLVTDMHNCASRIVDFFSGKPVECGNSPSHAGSVGDTVNASAADKSSGDSLASNPAKLCYVLKQSLRECAVAGAKLLILCDLFARRKNELSRVERHEIIKYTKTRLPVFMHQLHKLLEVARQMFSDMPASQRHDIAMYLVPQIETALETMSQFVVETKSALEQIISTSNSASKSANLERSGNKPVREVLGKSLRQVLHIKEVKKLSSFYDKISLNFMNLLQKKANFANMTSGNKVRSVAKNLEQGIDEIPLFLLRLEELINATDEQLTWREWKYTFKLGTSKVAWILQKLVGHSPALRTMILQVCDMVHRDQFTQSMIALGLLDPPVDQESSPVASAAVGTASAARPAAAPPTSNRLNTLESLSVPPLARESNLAKSAVHLLKSERESDMIFEIISVEDVSDTVIDHTLEGEPVGHTTQEQEVQLHPIKAHQVIVASRCDWFRRALLSGMRESIDKKIVVHDTNPALFKVFLEYLYGGMLDVASLTTEQLADLMLLSDRYEVDSLKSVTEMTLKRSINQDSALFLLSIADQFNAKSLRSAALEFVAASQEIMESEVFGELPDDLQGEVEFLATWGNPPSYERADAAAAATRKSYRTEESRRGPCLLQQCHYDGSVEDMISNMRLSGREVDPSDSSSLEDVPLTQDSSQLEACVGQLREIIGESVPHEELVRISLAADYDVNRALNFFYT